MVPSKRPYASAPGDLAASAYVGTYRAARFRVSRPAREGCRNGTVPLVTIPWIAVWAVTVIVSLPDGSTDQYMRFGDAYIAHDDGRLDILRGGAPAPRRYAAGEWTGVAGDEKRWRRTRFRR